ncbi:MAG: hypothetical protein M3469_06905 [Actinomycetota bacterium]|nr:hypothetical protein [Actinomycetota bacterium]MDQ3409691.1 hypothetical protein [Actinomycetota bacterium]
MGVQLLRRTTRKVELTPAGPVHRHDPRSQALASHWPGIAFRPVADLTPATLALGWRVDDETPVVQALVELARDVAAAPADDSSAGELPCSSRVAWPTASRCAPRWRAQCC